MRYIYDGEDILLEYDGSNVLQARFTHGPGIDEPIAVTRGGNTFFYDQDGLGTVTDLTDSAGATAKSYVYDAYGNIIDQTGTVDQPYTYTGREFDAETGLYYYRARYYDSASGRFLQKDPIGHAGGDPNLYNYVRGNSVNLIDPRGNIVILPILVGVWAVTELGLSVSDAVSTIQTLLDSCSSTSDKLLSASLFFAGVVGPGGGYSTAAKAFNAEQDALIQLAKEAKAKGITKQDANDLLQWADEFGVKPANNHIGTDHWVGGDHIRIGPINHIPVK